MIYSTAVVLLALLQYLVFVMLTGAARGKFGVRAPACSGNEHFERYFRVQQNTQEQMIVFIPAIFLFSIHVSDTWAAVIGGVYLLGRSLYAYSYIKEPAKRGPGMLLTFFPNLILVVGSGIGLGLSFVI